MPAGVQAGDLIVVAWVGGSGSSSTGTLDGKWTAMRNTGLAGAIGFRASYAVADGSESSAALDLLTQATALAGASLTYVYRDWGNVPITSAPVSSSTTTTHDPASLTTGYGAVDTTFLAISTINNGSTALTTAPSGYGSVKTAAGGACQIKGYTRDAAVATEDPSAFVWAAAVSGISIGIAIRGSYALSATDTGAGVEPGSGLEADHVRTDTGSGVEISTVGQGKTGVDTGSSVEISVASASIPAVDAGAGSELVTPRTFGARDTGTGADASNVRIVIEAVNPFPILPLTLAEALRRHQTPVARLTFIDADLETVLYTASGEINGGAVSTDRTRNINRSGSVELANASGLFTPASSGLVWSNRLVRIERGVLIGEAAQYAELMTGVIDEWQIEEGSGVVSFNVWSRLHLADQTFGAPVTLPAGTDVADAVRAIAGLAGLGSSDAFYDLDSGGAQLASARTYDSSSNMLDAMIKMAFDSGLDLYDDGHGRLVLHPFVDPSTVSPVWTFAPGELSVLTGARRSGRAIRSYNRAVVVASGPDRYPIRAEARVLNPDDPLYNPPDGSGPVGDRPRPIYTSSDISTQSAANSVAQRLLVEGALYEEQIALSSVPIGLLSSRSVVEVQAAGVSDNFLLDKTQCPIGKGSMPLESRRVRSLLAP
jgi:hypothetical protein